MSTKTTPEDSQKTGFQVRLSNFEGPFDLLLQLIFAHRLDVTEVALHTVTDDFIAYTKEIGKQLELDETTAFLVIAATLLDLKAARLLPAGEVHDEEDLALLEVRDLLFARLLQYRAYKHVAEMFAELEAAALRSYPRSVALEERYEDLLPEVMLGVDAEMFAQIAAIGVHPATGPGRAHRPPAHACRVGARAGPAPADAARAARRRTVGDVRRSGGRLLGVDRDRGALPGAARTVPGPRGSIRAIRTAWSAAGFVDRRPAHQRAPGIGGGRDRLMTDDVEDLDLGVDLGIDVAEPPEMADGELGAALEALLLVVDAPVAADALAAALGPACLPGDGQAAPDGRRADRPRQWDRPARGRGRLAHVHQGPVRAVRRAAAARRRPARS